MSDNKKREIKRWEEREGEKGKGRDERERKKERKEERREINKQEIRGNREDRKKGKN